MQPIQLFVSVFVRFMVKLGPKRFILICELERDAFISSTTTNKLSETVFGLFHLTQKIILSHKYRPVFALSQLVQLQTSLFEFVI